MPRCLIIRHFTILSNTIRQNIISKPQKMAADHHIILELEFTGAQKEVLIRRLTLLSALLAE